MSPVSLLRRLALIEGTSFLILLFLAMPLKYLADQPLAVKWVGWIHGLLFVAFAVQLAVVFFQCRWPVVRAALVMTAALIPFGPWLIDGRMKGYMHEAPPEAK
jgi:integral membrane protein